MGQLHAVTIGEAFGWLHENGTCRRAALLLPPIGYDLLGVHQTLHHAARLLSEAGIVALRLDYPGSGDALDPAPAPARVDVWMRAVDAAIDWLKAQTGQAEVVVMGVRFGAALAARCALARRDLSHLVLLEPVLDGAAFVREARVISRMVMARDLPPGAAAAATDGIEIEGFVLDDALIEELRRLKPLQTPLPHPLATLSMSSVPQPALAAWCGDLRAFDFPQRAALELTAIPPAPPLDDLRRLVAALDGGETRRLAWQLPEARLATERFTERALRFGAQDELAGILCEPAGRRSTHAVLFLNTGAIHHIGNGRIWVEEARALAEQGIASLRMDIAGLGESACRDDGPLRVLYAEDRAADLGAAIDRLAGEGLRSFTACGICSGAYLAMQAAFAEPRIGHVVAVNPQVIFFPDGPRDMTAFLTRSVSSSRVYMNRFGDVNRWKRLLRGEVDVATVLRIFAGIIARQGARFGAAALAGFDRIVPRPSQGRRIWSAFRDLSARGARLSILFSDSDVGLDEFDAQLGPYRARVQALPGVRVEVVSGCDHVFASRPAKAALHTFLTQQLGAPS